MIYEILMPFLAALGTIVFPRFLYLAEEKKNFRRALLLKALSSLCFVALSIIASLFNADKSFVNLVVIGQIFGAVGDVVMNLTHIFPRKKYLFYASGVLFFIGHIFFIIALFPKVGYAETAVYFAAAVSLAALLVLVQITKCDRLFRITSSLYIAAVASFFALSLLAVIRYAAPGRALMFDGALMFLLSDIAIVVGKVGTVHPKWLNLCRYVYYPAQIMIAVSLCLFV